MRMTQTLMRQSQVKLGQLHHLLLIEDDEVDVMNVQRALKKNNLELPLSRVRNGQEALNFLQELNHGLDLEGVLIITDINMPKMNGLEFLRHLRQNQQFAHLPVVILTTSAQPEDIAAAYQFNVAGYFIKPLEFQEFVEVIQILTSYWSHCLTPL
jgi:CheY-like chemotaxis protein